MAKQKENNAKVLQNPILSNAVKKLEEYTQRKEDRLKEYQQKVADLKKIKSDTGMSMLREKVAGDMSAYAEDKQKHDKAVEQLDFLETYKTQTRNYGGCAKEEADTFYSEIREGFEEVCRNLDEYLIEQLEKMRVRLAEAEQLGSLLSDACKMMATRLDAFERPGIILGSYEYGTSDIGKLLSEWIYTDPLYIEKSGVEQRRSSLFGTTFSDEIDKETEEISRELFAGR